MREEPKRRMPLGLRLVCIAAALLPVVPALAVTGTIVDEQGSPIPGVQVCYFHAGAEQICVETNGHGLYVLFDSSLDTLRATKTGFHAATFSAKGQQAPFVLKRSPSLWVRLIDAAGGRPVEKGELYVVYPSGVEKGPFPVNRAGVKIERVLEAGEVLLRAEAEGFDPPQPRSVTLEAGKELKLDLELSRTKAP